MHVITYSKRINRHGPAWRKLIVTCTSSFITTSSQIKNALNSNFYDNPIDVFIDLQKSHTHPQKNTKNKNKTPHWLKTKSLNLDVCSIDKADFLLREMNETKHIVGWKFKDENLFSYYSMLRMSEWLFSFLGEIPFPLSSHRCLLVSASVNKRRLFEDRWSATLIKIRQSERLG